MTTLDESNQLVRKFLSLEAAIALFSLIAIAAHLTIRFGPAPEYANVPLYAALVLGGSPLVFELGRKALRAEFGSDLLAGISIVTSLFLNEYLAGTLVVLMLSGGEALERYAVRRAASVLAALARRMPQLAHKKNNGQLTDIPVSEIVVGDTVEVFPHEICPVDGLVVNGYGHMDEAYLTGEPYQMSKAPGSDVISGAINGDTTLTIQATRLAQDSRYARIANVLKESENKRAPMRRLGDTLGAWYTPLAVGVAVSAWIISGDATRFLAVLVVATPCPLLIAIPVAIIGAISVAAKRSIIIRDPAILETLRTCNTVILDKTGTLTIGEPTLTDEKYFNGFERAVVLGLVGSLEQYSKHPLAVPLVGAARKANITFTDVTKIRELPGEGLVGEVGGHSVLVRGTKELAAADIAQLSAINFQDGGLLCVVFVDNTLAALYRFRDVARPESSSFISHLAPLHGFRKIMLVSGDRETEVRYLAEKVGITDVHAGKSPEEKLAIVKAESLRSRTLFIGDGINDAPALMYATAGIALGQKSDVTSEAAGAVIMDASLAKVDELFHISYRMRSIALQSAVGGMALSIVGMGFAAFGFLPPVFGALAQEAIDLFAVINALRATLEPKQLTDF